MEDEDTHMYETKIFHLQRELRIARNEICNLRQQMKTLKFSHQKDIDDINTKLLSWECFKCQDSSKDEKNVNNSIPLIPIGVLSTLFPRKRAVPRQPGINIHSKGKLTLFNSVLTNPEHALEGLSEFSHLWILFYFDRNESTHIHAKVSPPRLNGERIGVFATRSPHRPCPIGMSLVRLDSIQGSTIFFSGVDMLDGTPVFDIKPFIPRYDDPMQQVEVNIEEDRLEVRDIPLAPGSPGVCPGNREAPDGEDSDEDHPSVSVPPAPENVRVPSWVTPGAQMKVELTPDAEVQLEELQKMDLKPVILNVLQEDPRSVYLKQRYSNQFYTFLISDLHVSCKFNDSLNSVTVYRISQARKLCECGEQEWQCSNHSLLNE